MAMIRCPLNESAHISMNESAIVSSDGALLYTETEQCVVATVELLTKKGVSAGDRVGLLLNDGWEQVVVFWALLRIGAVACPLAGLSGGDALTQAISVAQLKWVVQDGTRPAPEGVSLLNIKDLVGFTGLFKKDHRPKLELSNAAVIFPRQDAEGTLSLLTHTVGSCYYAALAGNATLPLRSSSKHHWALEPLHTYRGVDTIFRCAVAGVGVATGMKRPLDPAEINALDVTHVTVESGDVAGLLERLGGGETELTHMLIAGSAEPAQLAALRALNVQPVMTLGTAATGYYAVVDHQRRIHPMRYSKLKVDDGQQLMVSGKTLAHEVTDGWVPTEIICRNGPDQVFMLPESND